MPLKPILRPDATRDDQIDLRTARDFIGVEWFDAEVLRGINRQAKWTRDVGAWAQREHRLDGVHDTARIPRGVCWMDFGYIGTGASTLERYGVQPESYLHGTYESQLTGLFTVAAIVADGVIDIDLAIPMPSTDFGVMDMSMPETWWTPSPVASGWQRVWVTGEAISATRVRIKRRAERARISHGYHGQFAFALIG